MEKELEEFIKSKLCINGRAGTCRECSNKYNSQWKRRNSQRLGRRRRELYARDNGAAVKAREEKRQREYPLKYRCQVLRSGMVERARVRNIEFDSDYFTVTYLMERLTDNPNCECCNKILDLTFKNDRQKNDNSPSMDRVDPKNGYTRLNTAIVCWRCNNIKRDSTPGELRMIADFMEGWE